MKSSTSGGGRSKDQKKKNNRGTKKVLYRWTDPNGKAPLEDRATIRQDRSGKKQRRSRRKSHNTKKGGEEKKQDRAGVRKDVSFGGRGRSLPGEGGKQSITNNMDGGEQHA